MLVAKSFENKKKFIQTIVIIVVCNFKRSTISLINLISKFINDVCHQRCKKTMMINNKKSALLSAGFVNSQIIFDSNSTQNDSFW